MPVVKRFRSLPPIDQGRAYLIVMMNYWGKGPTIEEAIKNVKKASSDQFKPSQTRCLVYDADESVYLEDVFGDMITPKGKDRPRLLGEFE